MAYWDDLDPDTQIQILQKLPLKTLVRLLCASKSISTLITSPTFTISVNPRKTLYHIYSYNFTPQVDDQRFMMLKDSDPIPVQQGTITWNGSIPINFSYSFIGSCDGLVCFSNNLHVDDQKLVFWNPFLGRHLAIPMPPMCDRRYELGFGRDLAAMDYKVVRIGILTGQTSVLQADIFLVFSRTWRKVMGRISHKASKIMGRGVYLNGVIHWAIKRKEPNNNGPRYSIVSLDLSKEVFEEIPGPPECAESVILTTLTIYGQEKLVAYDNPNFCNVWVMGKYGTCHYWWKLCTIFVGFGEYGTILNAWENGWIIVSTNKWRLFMYNPSNDQKLLVVANNPHDRKSSLEYVGPYVHSLVFPKSCHGGVQGNWVLQEEEEEEEEEEEKMELD